MRYAADAISLMCALFMFCVVPLLFHDAFFDINRVKVDAVVRIVPVLLLLHAFACMGAGQKRCALPGHVSGILLLFLGFCAMSCLLNGLEPAMLTGSEGRYCGLYFMLSCGAAFLIIASGRCRLIRGAVVPAMVCASACALLGVMNAMGVDPLGFYARIQKGQEKIFMSTIGHFDFFGTYLIMMFPLAAGQFVFSRSGLMRLFGFLCAALMALGAMASRTDSALAGLHLGCMMLLALSGGSYAVLSRAFLLWSFSFTALPLMFRLLQHSAFDLWFSGLSALLYDLHAAEILAVVFACAGVACAALHRRGAAVPGKRRWMKGCFSGFGLLAIILFASILYFSVFDTDAFLGKAASFLRFDDHWGSLRGFAWIRSIRAFADFPLMQKVFGAGMELTLRVLTPYFDDPAMLAHGVFNDPHCQLLQMLLTCGLLGMILFAAFYISVLAFLFRHAGEDPVCCGVLGAVWSYSIVLLINVTQPILIATYFSLCALGVGSISPEYGQEGGRYES